MCKINDMAEINKKKEEIKQFIEELKTLYSNNSEKRILKYSDVYGEQA